MKCLLILLLAGSPAFAQATKDASTLPASKPNDANRGVKPHVIVIPKSEEQLRAENWAVIVRSADRYKAARAWLDRMTAKYEDEVGEDENHILGRHYAELAESYEQQAVPMGDQLIEDLEYFRDDATPLTTLTVNTLLVDAQHLNLILAGLETEERKWLHSHAKDRIEPGTVIVVK